MLVGGTEFVQGWESVKKKYNAYHGILDNNKHHTTKMENKEVEKSGCKTVATRLEMEFG